MLPHYNPKNPWAKDEGGCSGLAEMRKPQQLYGNRTTPSALLFLEIAVLRGSFVFPFEGVG